MTLLDGLLFAHLTVQQAVDLVSAHVRLEQGLRLITPNTDVLRLASQRPDVRSLLADAHLLVADGMPLVWLSRVTGEPLPERVPGSTLAEMLLVRAVAEDWRLAVIGSAPGVAERAVLAAGAHAPTSRMLLMDVPANFSVLSAEADRLLRELTTFSPRLVLVGLSFEKQEAFLSRVQRVLPSAVLLGCGIGLAYAAQVRTRAPVWLQKAGLEWAHRLLQEPRRLTRRYLLEDGPFLLHLLWRTLRLRFGRQWSADGP